MRQTKSQDIQKRIKQTVKALSSGIWEKDQLIAMGILCCVSGESLFLLGPPGTGKSLIARRLKEALGDSRAFEYLMSRFSTPDEIFGPVSIRKLREEDCYERCTDGYLPSADIVFLDEIWKAGPAIQNALLTVINEKIFQNGAVTMRLPLKLLIAASNELPKEDEGLEALWDRFLVRCVSGCIENETSFYKMLRQDTPATVEIDPSLKISAAELEAWNRAITEIELPDSILKIITRIRLELKALSKAENTDPLDFYVSDSEDSAHIGISEQPQQRGPDRPAPAVPYSLEQDRMHGTDSNSRDKEPVRGNTVRDGGADPQDRVHAR